VQSSSVETVLVLVAAGKVVVVAVAGSFEGAATLGEEDVEPWQKALCAGDQSVGRFVREPTQSYSGVLSDGGPGGPWPTLVWC